MYKRYPGSLVWLRILVTVMVMIMVMIHIPANVPSTAALKASARINRPSASVFVISVVFPFLALITSPGRNAIPEILFSAMGNKHLQSYTNEDGGRMNQKGERGDGEGTIRGGKRGKEGGEKGRERV